MTDQSEQFSGSIQGLPREYLPSLKKLYPSKEAYESMIHAAEYICYCRYNGLRISYDKFKRISMSVSYLLNTPEGCIFHEVNSAAKEGIVVDIDDIDNVLQNAYYRNHLRLPFDSFGVQLV